MLNNYFSKGLMSATAETLSQQIAMWDDMTLWKIIWKIKAGKKTGLNRLKTQIDDNTLTLQKNYDLDELKLMLFFRLCKQLKLYLPQKITLKDFDLTAQQIESNTIKILKRTEKDFSDNNTKGMIKYILKKMFDDLSKTFSEQDASKQKELISKIIESITSMPEDQRKILLRELKIDKITDEAIRKALITGAMGTAFVAVVEIAGFSAYIFAAKALAAAAAIVGITLPFAVYMMLTSMIAVFTNPLFWVPAILGGGIWLTRRGNRQIRERMSPMVVTIICVSSTLDIFSDNGIKDFIDKYNTNIDKYEFFSKNNRYEDLNKIMKQYPGINNLIKK
jgi:hypothetical protein